MRKAKGRKSILISIKPNYADKIFARKKMVELRRALPKIEDGDEVVVYVSSPVKAVVGRFTVNGILRNDTASLWTQVSERAGVSQIEFMKYFQDKEIGYGIEIREAEKMAKPLTLEMIKNKLPKFHPPQSFLYLENSPELGALIFNTRVA